MQDLLWFATNPENAGLPDYQARPFVVFGNEYWDSPLGSADYITIFGSTFAIFDSFPDSAGARPGSAGAAVADYGAELADIVAHIS